MSEEAKDNPAWVALTESEPVWGATTLTPVFSQKLLNMFYASTVHGIVKSTPYKDHALDALTYITFDNDK